MYSFVVNSYGDHYLHEVNGSSLNKYGSIRTIDERFGELILNEDFLFIIVGTDSGQIVSYLMEKGVPNGSEYIFIESDELYQVIRGVFPDHSQLHLCTHSTWRTVAEECNLSIFIQANCASVVNSIAVRLGLHSPYTELASRIKMEFDSVASNALKNAELIEFFKAGLLNLADNRFSVAGLFGNYEKDTAIILGAGPSLNENIEWIKKNQQYIYIFSVSRICKKLYEEGIVPDFIVTVDSNDFSYEAGKEAFVFENKSVLIHSFHANSQIVGQWLGDKVFTGDRFPWKTDLNNDCIAQNGTTVTNIAYDSALTIGFKKILLAGVDFCHDADGFTHASGAGNELACAPCLNLESTYVLNNKGMNVETTQEFRNAGGDFSERARDAVKDGVITINLSSAAMKMDCVEYVDKEKVSLSTREKRKVTIGNKGDAELFYSAALKELKKALSELKMLSKYADEAIQKNLNLFDGFGNKSIKKENQLIKIEKRLNDNSNRFVPLIKIVGLRNNLKYLRATRKKGHEWTQKEITESNVAYYKEFKKNSSQLKSIINSSMSRVRSRMQEKDIGSSDLSVILGQWIKDEHPRRVKLIGSKEMLEKQSENISEMLSELKKIEGKINSRSFYPDSLRSDKVKESFVSISGFANKLDVEGLYFLYKKIVNQPESNVKEVYVSFCEGMIQYVEGKKIEAFNTLTDLLGKNELFSENELEYILAKVSIVAIELKDYENAKVALETLSQTFSSYYIPKYAELLYLTGDTDEALDCYEKYINSYPNDLDAIFSLAELQRKEGHIDSAVELYQFILSINPDYGPAKNRLASAEISV